KEQQTYENSSSEETEVRSKRAQIAIDLRNGKLEEEWVTVEVTEQTPSIFDALQGTGMDMSGNNGMQDMLSSLMPKKQKKRRVQVKDARRILTIEEANKLIDADEVAKEAISRAEQSGIIFIDEIDKIASKEGNSSANVS